LQRKKEISSFLKRIALNGALARILEMTSCKMSETDRETPGMALQVSYGNQAGILQALAGWRKATATGAFSRA
jgi:hypothetical protein